MSALRYDTGKTPWHLLPTDGLRLIADHFGRGAAKYAERNWEKGMKFSRVYNSLLRHLTAFWEGEDYDNDPYWKQQGVKVLHIVAVAWNALVLVVYVIRGVGEDDRPSKLVAVEAPPAVTNA